jgi:integrase/recombinase XerD
VRVQRVLSPRDGSVSWTVIGPDLRPVPAIESYLAWLSHIECSPNTVRAYASDLKAFWTFLGARGASWEQPSLELLGEFTAWLRQPAENVVMLPSARSHRSTRTVNRMLTAVAGFYEYHARNGVEFARSSATSAAPVAATTSRSCTGSRRPRRAGGSGGCASRAGCHRC